MPNNTSAAFARSALSRCGDDAVTVSVVNEVQQVLAPGEFILEVAKTTAPGFPSACVCTTSRLFLGAGPGRLTVLEHSWLTFFAGRRYGHSAELTLTLTSFDAEVNWIGFNETGLGRILHALDFVVNNDQSNRPERAASIPELFNRWVDVRTSSQNEFLTEEQYELGVREAIGEKQWIA